MISKSPLLRIHRFHMAAHSRDAIRAAFAAAAAEEIEKLNGREIEKLNERVAELEENEKRILKILSDLTSELKTTIEDN